jgi:Cu(I)/Ag(I) efflux system membrane fusion protein/cobalt-zinc-cadmium efflux system membrane fusion protein
MSRAARRTLVFVLLLASVLAVLAGVAFTTRYGIAGVPLVNRWFAGAPAAAPMYVCPMHPEVRQATPGSCPKCGMDLEREPEGAAQARDDARPSSEPQAQGDAHGHPEGAASSAPSQVEGPAPAAPPRAGVQLDLRRQQLVGVRVTEAETADITRTVRSVGTVTVDETRQAEVNLKVEAWIRDLYVNTTGQAVRAGQPLFTIYSPDLVATQDEFLLALRTRDQVRASPVADARDYADRLVEAARTRLALWDIPADQLASVEQTRKPITALVFRSPVSGVVVEKRAVAGMRAMPGEMLYRIIDLSSVWVEADVYERDLPFVRVGSRAVVTFDALPDQRVAGRIAFVYPAVQEATRAARVRVVLPNPGGRLKPGMYASLQVDATLGRGLVVPTDAVIDSGAAQYVFVAEGDGFFAPRRVQTGPRLEGRIQVTSGLAPGERVASAAAFFIDSESQMRAAMEGYAEPPAGDAGVGATRTAAADAPVITFATEPDPPRNGDNAFVVTLRGADGAPIVDAEVAVRFYMAPMPSMNMPAMRADAALLHEEGGRYRGRGRVTMAGRWDVTVVASRGGQRLGSRQFAIVAQ